MTRALLIVACLLGVAPTAVRAQRPADVRQIVTFLFEPGRTDSALAIYERELVPAYLADTAMRRFRVYREAESPEPLDLIVVSRFDGMAGMDASNAALRRLSSGGRSVFQWYGALAALSQRHHDQFVEMLPALGDGAVAAGDSSGGLLAMEYVRLAPGMQGAYERHIADRVRPAERARRVARWTETGRLLVSDGWDYVRFIGVASLGEWAGYHEALRTSGVAREADRLVAARKVILVRQLPRFSVR